MAQLVKESTCNAGDLGLIPELGRSPGEGKGYPLQYSGRDSPWGGKELDTTEQLSVTKAIIMSVYNMVITSSLVGNTRCMSGTRVLIKYFLNFISLLSPKQLCERSTSLSQV